MMKRKTKPFFMFIRFHQIHSSLGFTWFVDILASEKTKKEKETKRMILKVVFRALLSHIPARRLMMSLTKCRTL